ncbi:MAG TPA: ankyrin repeat domain-containing protein [Vicinamibacterales bacterium]|nr:ankyrin repeat domain-containing protein [Vicinamibacterales bacterium]
MSFESLRREAKRLLRACRSGDSSSLIRIRAALPRMVALDDDAIRASLQLADTQHAIAREHGQENWGALKRSDDPIARCLVAVRGGALSALTSQLAEFAPRARESAHVAAALGAAVELERHLDRDASIVAAEDAGWVPLAYVCASPLHRLSARHAAGLLQCARLLLDRGADPNATTPGDPATSATPMPVGIRAALGGNAAVAMLLQRRGASTGATPGVQHLVREQLQATAAANPLAEIVREYFQRPDVRAAMQEAFDRWRAEHGIAGHQVPLDLRDLLTPKHPQWPGINGLWAEDAGKFDGIDRMAQYSAHRLVRAAPAGLVEMVLARGVDPNLHDANGRTLLAEAVRSGNAPAADVLRSAGGDDAAVSSVDRWLGACLRLAADEAGRIASHDPGLFHQLTPDDYDVLLRAASANRLDILTVMLTSGADANGTGMSGATALHHAAWHGHLDAVRILLTHGARRDVRDVAYGARPVEWAIHGATHCRDADEDYQAVREALGD